MSQQPFSRPGAVDLSGLKQSGSSTGAGGAAGGAPGAYSVQVDDQSFQQVLESSMTAPVLLVFYSTQQSPDSVSLANNLETLSDEFAGQFLLGKVDIDAAPGIVEQMQIPSVPLAALVLQGRPVPLLQESPPLDDLRRALEQVMQQVAQQGMTARHEPREGGQAEEQDTEPAEDPRYAPAQDALAAGDVATAVAEYQKLVDADPSDAEATAGLAMARVLERTQGVDLESARNAAAERPDDVAAQTLVADLDLLGGHVDDAFGRLIELVRRTSGDERDRARNHLLALFDAVGNDDQRVLDGRRALASALF